MSPALLVGVLLVLSAAGYWMGRSKAVAVAGPGTLRTLHSLPDYHGFFVALWCGLPALILTLLWMALAPPIIRDLALSGIGPDQVAAWLDTVRPAGTTAETVAAARAGGLDALDASQTQLLLIQIGQIASGNERFVSPDVQVLIGDAGRRMAMLQSLSTWGSAVVVLALAIGGLTVARRRIARAFRARNAVERIVLALLITCSVIAVLTTVGIVLSLLFESIRFFAQVSPFDFLFGIYWSPQTALRADQVGSSGTFGAVPLFTGTLLISFIAMVVAVPVGLMSAIYLSEYASHGVRNWVKPLLEILAGIPTVVYGFFAILTVAPVVRDLGQGAGLGVASNSALAAGLVMGIMIVPFVSSLSDDVINAVPQSLRDGSFSVGATRSETIRQVILPAALPGIVGAVLLAVSRAIGETMIVVMAAGLAANLTANPFAAVTTVTVQIATLLVGDQEFDSPKTLSVFALGLVLFVVTLVLNVIALRIVQKYREKYD
jgi:phosphate transport system permease protein